MTGQSRFSFSFDSRAGRNGLDRPEVSPPKLAWQQIYSEAELYKAAVRLYTKPLFSWRKALSTSVDERTLFDFARHGLQNLEAIHRSLAQQRFHFRPGLALHFNFNGKHRTLHIFPWAERLVDLLLYRLLNESFHPYFSPHTYAYRFRGFGLDRCQRTIARAAAGAEQPLYILKRDIADYFPSIDHAILLAQLEQVIDPGDYLFELLRERIHFQCLDGGRSITASVGIPFGTAIACFFANFHLNDLDRRISAIPGVRYFRYADDLLVLSRSREAILTAEHELRASLAVLHLRSKPSHEQNLFFSTQPQSRTEEGFTSTTKFRHLGLEFRASGVTGLSRDKFRKICNLFRFAFRRYRGRFRKIQNPERRAELAVRLAQKTLDQGVRNVAIIDYYLKHVEDEGQLRRLDRWLAEEVLSLAFGGGHKKGYFRKISYERLRAMGLPSLVHRRRLIRHGRIASPFFIWKAMQMEKSSRGTAAKPRRQPERAAVAAFSPFPEAAAGETS
jgi:hypothetical protein